MNNDQAKEVLLLYRSGISDDQDPLVARALEMTRSDPALALWFTKHAALQSALRAGFRHIPVPEGLREQILSEIPGKAASSRRSRRRVFSASLAFLMLCFGFLILLPRAPHSATFASYRARMLKFALRGYQMDLETNDLASIRRYLSHSDGRGDAALPAGLERGDGGIEPTGCALLSWQTRPVSMICFGKHGRTDLWLFMVDSQVLPDAPQASQPRFEDVNEHTVATACWSRDGRTYLLARRGNEASIKQYF